MHRTPFFFPMYLPVKFDNDQIEPFIDFNFKILTNSQLTNLVLVHPLSVSDEPFLLTIDLIAGQKPDVFVKHHSPQVTLVQFGAFPVQIVCE